MHNKMSQKTTWSVIWRGLLLGCDIAGPSNGPPDGVVDIDDLFEVLANWGPCP